MNAPAEDPSEYERARFRVFDYVARIRRAIMEGNAVEVDGYRRYVAPAIEAAWGSEPTLEIRTRFEPLLSTWPPDEFTLAHLKELDDALDTLG